MTREEKYIMTVMADELSLLQLNENVALSKQVRDCLEWIRIKESVVTINNQISILIKQNKYIGELIASGHPDAHAMEHAHQHKLRELKRQSNDLKLELSHVESKFDWEFIANNFQLSRDARSSN